ncbi:MAG: hypothetical protein U0835_09615 [Isosphaeraceae bacterium]
MILLGMIHIYWFVVPLVVSISLVYSASRHEAWSRILSHALRLGGWIFGLLLLVTAVLLLINTQV